MSKIQHNKTISERRQARIRKKLFGTAERPRLTVFRSNMHISLQVINDDLGKTLVGLADNSTKGKFTGNKTERAIKVAESVATSLKELKIKALVFDRGHYRYHGRVKAVAETMRKAGLNV
ncbi:MAG: 50S ribosomal protein L18 [Patescibacteria group bacterium]